MVEEENVETDETPDEQTEGNDKGGLKKIIMIVAIVLLVIGGAGAAYFLGGNSSTPTTDNVEVPIEEPEEEETEEEEADPIYLPLKQFVMSFDHNGDIRYLQLSIQVMSYQQDAIDKVAANMPAVRNSLIMLFSSQNYDSLQSIKGKEQLREEVMDAINTVVRLKGKVVVNDVFFTDFVLQ